VRESEGNPPDPTPFFSHALCGAYSAPQAGKQEESLPKCAHRIATLPMENKSRKVPASEAN
jgi:hypothetical protein